MSYIKKFTDLANCIRMLSACAIEKAKSGHPGMPLGFADVFTVLVFEFLNFMPYSPKWENRDRLILSAGHGSMLLYSFYYLTGYKGFSIESIKNFRQLDSITPGHPEYSDIVETTTGPLGQGFANAVGMAIAAKKNQASYKTYCIVGDGCLMEGISYEAASLAGHLCLSNLIVLFDSNKITIDGRTDLTISEDQRLKFESLGWEVLEIDGHDLDKIRGTLYSAQKSKKPCIIICNTIIGYGCNTKAGSEKSHGAPLGKEEIEYLKQSLNWDHDDFVIPNDLLNLWRKAWKKKNILSCIQDFKSATSKFDFDIKNLNSLKEENITEATRVSSNQVINYLAEQYDNVIFGSADLSQSIGIKPSNIKPISKDDFSGNFIHYGIRENVMAGIMNGLSIEGFLPIGGTFLVFSDYMKPGIRLSALMNLGVIYVMSHDSIGVGEDGPTHQPVEHLASLRSVPNLTVFRPADRIETIESWQIALSLLPHPSVLVLSRQKLPSVRNFTDDNLSGRGAYIISNEVDSDVSLFATGSEVHIALEIKELLEKENVKACVISIPSFEILSKQPISYFNSLIKLSNLNIGIEAGCSFGWHKIIGTDGMFFGVESFGLSGPYKDLQNYYGLTAANIVKKIIEKLDK